MNYPNPMQIPRIEKVTVHIGVGESGERLIKAEKLLNQLTGVKPVRTSSTHRIPAWDLKTGESIGCKVTLRGDSAIKLLKNAFYAKDNIIKESQFDTRGNFSFGIHEHIDLKDIKYDPEIGIWGMDINVTIERPGYRIKKMRVQKKKIPSRNLITKEESIEFIKENFGVKIEE